MGASVDIFCADVSLVGLAFTMTKLVENISFGLLILCESYLELLFGCYYGVTK